MITVKTMIVILLLSLLVRLEALEISASLLPSPSSSSTVTFDFIVIGSGASGSVVAARLAKRNVSVLLIEGGAEGTGQRDVGGTDYVASYFKTDPVTGKQSLDTPVTRYDVPTMADSIRIASDVLDNMWPINSTGPFYAQAKVIGGNQATNGLAWTPILKQNIDDWNIPGFSSTEFWPYLRKVEDATPAGFGSSPDRGNSGPISVQFSTFVPRDQLKFEKACIDAGHPVGTDMNVGVINRGVYRCQSNIKAGIRQSSSVAYIAPLLKQNNPYLTLRSDSIVTRILFNSQKNATGVEYVNKYGQLKIVNATKEVILAAGDLQVAKILMNSGIGPLSTLNAFGKPHIVVNELVGQKIRNHQRIAIRYNDSELVNPNYYVTPAASVEYARTGTGIQEGRAFFFLYFNSTNCTTRCPDLQATPGASAGATGIDPYAQTFSVSVGINRNLYANGTLNLTSSNPLAATKFTANILLLDEDVKLLADGILQTRKLMNTHWEGNLVEVAPGPAYNTTALLIPWIRANAGTTCHYYGSAPMGSSASNSVTDSRMRVHGVKKLRVVGPSVIPGPIFPGMQHMACGLGEKGAALIIEDYSL